VGKAIKQILAWAEGDKAYDASYAEVRDLQLEALNERLQEQVGRIRVLGFRAREAEITEIKALADVVPLLLPHTAYKSYPENYLMERRWDRLTKWLGTTSAYPLDDVDLTGIETMDQWIDRLQEAGHFVSCSSGTTGKSAMLIGNQSDMDFTAKDAVDAFAWGSGVAPAQDRIMFGLAPVAAAPRNTIIGTALYQAFNRPDVEPFRYPVPPMTVGSITDMIVLRKKIAEGTALPSELAEFEATSAERQKAVDSAVEISAEAAIDARGEMLYVSGMWATLYKVAEAVRAKGYSAKDFHPENTMYVGGGLKGAQLPADYQEYVYETFNIRPERNYQMYGMQEIGSSMPRCQKGSRYHLPPWLVCLPLNREGDQLLDIGEGEIEGRAAFFDLSLEGRWGGVISGDRISVDFSPCACGSASPSIRDNITRYSDIEGDDKIGCSGTVDAYVRGVS
jgi:hypothetical protein